MKNTGNQLKNLTLAGLTAAIIGCATPAPTAAPAPEPTTEHVRTVQTVPVYETPTGELSPTYLNQVRIALRDDILTTKELSNLRSLLGTAQNPNRAREARILKVLDELSIDRDTDAEGVQRQVDFPIENGGRVFEYHIDSNGARDTNGYVIGAQGAPTQALALQNGRRTFGLPAGYTMSVGTPGNLTDLDDFEPLSDIERNRKHSQLVVTLPQNAQGERVQMTWYSADMNDVRYRDIGFRLLTGEPTLANEVLRPLDLVAASQTGATQSNSRALLAGLLNKSTFVGKDNESDLEEAVYHLAGDTRGTLKFDDISADSVTLHYGVPRDQLENAKVGTAYGEIRVTQTGVSWDVTSRTQNGVMRLNTTWNMSDRRAKDLVTYVTERATQLNHEVPVLGRHEDSE